MQWFDQWAARHARLFGLTTEGDLATLLSWRELFLALGCTPQELDWATDWLATNARVLADDRTRFLGRLAQHLVLLQACVREQRAVAYRTGPNGPGPDRGTCTLCAGTGLVVVPHPAGVMNGHWVPVRATRGRASWYTCAVLCSCPLGPWVADHRDGDEVPPSLERYARFNPSWRQQMADRERSLLAEADLAPDRSDRLGRTLERLRKGLAMP